MRFHGREETVKMVQGILGLTQDGVDGVQTWSAILSRLNGQKPAASDTMTIPDTSGKFDDRTEKHLATLDPKARPKFRAFISAAKAESAKLGCSYVAICGNRTYAEQDALYAQGRTADGPKVTNARGGFSNHNFGIAMDFGVFSEGQYLDKTDPSKAAKVHRACAKHAGDNGIEWGGDWESFPDYPHFEIATGLSTSQKRTRFELTGSVL